MLLERSRESMTFGNRPTGTNKSKKSTGSSGDCNNILNGRQISNLESGLNTGNKPTARGDEIGRVKKSSNDGNMALG
ncbi:hypothetical protein ACN2AY_29385, partial [Klebsiella pneumoniae]|uniref:hypothetical protein n=1 Tax=Klebsiella pneumoniae TaxID=573 RepID=UPI003AF765DA